jgi:hypothetical protein
VGDEEDAVLKKVSILFGFLILAGALTAAAAPAVPALTVSGAGTPACAPARAGKALQIIDGWTVLDFEGVGDFSPVDDYYPGVHFSEEWAGLVDSDAGGSGNFANEPSPETTAFVPDDDPYGSPEIIPAEISLDVPAGGIGFHYASVTELVFAQPLAFELYDVNGNLLGRYTASDTPILGVGDPTGAFTSFYSVEVALTENSISRVVFLGGGSFWAMDNFRYRLLGPGGPETDEDTDEDSD